MKLMIVNTFPNVEIMFDGRICTTSRKGSLDSLKTRTTSIDGVGLCQNSLFIYLNTKLWLIKIWFLYLV